MYSAGTRWPPEGPKNGGVEDIFRVSPGKVEEELPPKEHRSLNTAPLRNPVRKALPLTHRYHTALLWRQNQKGPAAQASVQHV